jgi:hypothetical protein
MVDSSISGLSRKRQVFISYSREPQENAEFVRGLARQLRTAGFEVWLDEEQIAAGEDIAEKIKVAIEKSDAGLFVVNSRWLMRDRNWIRHEVALLGQQAGTRRLVLLREPAGEAELDPYFAMLKRLEWFPDDPRPHARFWEVYCGITGERPGPREEWEKRGRNVLSGSPALPGQPPEVSNSQREMEPSRIRLSCSGKPIAYFAGDNWTFLVTDRDEWVGLRCNGEVHSAIRQLGEFAAAAVSAGDALLVATYDATVARLKGQHWETLSQESPVLCFAVGPDGGDLVGTVGGGVVLLDRHAVKAAFRMRDPVVSMASYEGGLLVLGSRGMFGRLGWPVASGDQLKWIQTAAIGRPMGFFPAVDSNHIGIMSATRMAVIEPATERFLVCPRSFDEGIREIVFLGAQVWSYAVLTDDGTMAVTDANLTSTRPIRFPRGSVVVGCGRGWTGTTLAWTNEGRLYQISPDGIAEDIADGDVVLAYSPTGMNGVHVVRWHPEQGATVELVRAN